MIQCKPPVTPWCNNLSLPGKRPVRIKLPVTQIQYLRKVPGFRSAGHIYMYILSSRTHTQVYMMYVYGFALRGRYVHGGCVCVCTHPMWRVCTSNVEHR